MNRRCYSHNLLPGTGCPSPVRCFKRRLVSAFAWFLIRHNG